MRLSLAVAAGVVLQTGVWLAVAGASCGQAFCTVDSRLSASQPAASGQIRFDWSMEYIEQDQPRVGFHAAEVGDLMRPDHRR